jgi:Spy/CpxP family protein refolding chaperone
MSRYLYMIGGALLLLGGTIGIARGDFPHPDGWYLHKGSGPFPLAYLGHQLGLTETQRTQIKAIWREERPTVIPLLRQLVSESNWAAPAGAAFDESAARAAGDRQAATISQLLVERQRMISTIYSGILTPEQQQKADQLGQRMHTRIERLIERLEQPTD